MRWGILIIRTFYLGIFRSEFLKSHGSLGYPKVEFHKGAAHCKDLFGFAKAISTHIPTEVTSR